MAGEDSRLFNLLSYAVSGGIEDNVDEDGSRETISNIHNICCELIERDYEYEILKNTNGILCGTYPEKIIIPISQKYPQKMSKVLDCIIKSRFARTRSRFVVPVLLVYDKYICRSSTLARSPEIYCRRSYGYWVQGEAYDIESEAKVFHESSKEDDTTRSERLQLKEIDPDSDNITRTPMSCKESEEEDNGKEWLIGKMRNADINLLQFLQVDTIFDLMVENKKVKFGLNVTSSEKVDRQRRYLKFKLLSVPYPGCEFFTEYRKNDYCAEGLMFDWSQDFIDADLHVPKQINHLCDVPWEDYMKWDLVQLTQNYLKLHLRSLIGGESTGILLHCISGWDRTPLFISLVRLSLWADGLVHQSLNVEEMVYFTVAYDWLLFCHKFSERIANGEDIFYFCFDFLKYIYSDEYSMLPHARQMKDNEKKTENGSGLNGTPKVVDGEKEASGQSANHPRKQVSQGAVEEGSVCQSNGVHHGYLNGGERESDLNGIIETNWENCEASFNGVDCTFDSRADGLISVPDCEVPSMGAPAELEVSSSDVVQPKPNECIYSTVSESCVKMPTSQFLQDSSENQSTLPANSTRKEKLQCAREMIVATYQAAVRCQQDRQQASNSGFAAILYNQLSKTLSLGKR